MACHVQPVLVVQKSHGGEHLRVTGRAPGSRAALAHDGGRQHMRQHLRVISSAAAAAAHADAIAHSRRSRRE